MRVIVDTCANRKRIHLLPNYDRCSAECGNKTPSPVASSYRIAKEAAVTRIGTRHPSRKLDSAGLSDPGLQSAVVPTRLARRKLRAALARCGAARPVYAVAMSLGPIRPRFRMIIPGEVDERIALVLAAAARPERRCVSRVVGNHVDITVVPEDRHRWSPCVQLEFRQSGADTIVDGLVGPHPNMWTLFAFVYITIIVAVGFGLMLGLAQLSLGQPAWGLWTVLGGAVLLGGMYVTS
ncbi:MAG: hypothetical protein ACYTGR_12995, partial [Planctomycetota bacterium]